MLSRTKDYTRALVDLNQALSIGESSASLHNAMGICHSQMGTGILAVKQFTKASQNIGCNFNAFVNCLTAKIPVPICE
jgi:Tfp pilus assembly protein PilF